jgi:hypothetical protein
LCGTESSEATVPTPQWTMIVPSGCMLTAPVSMPSFRAAESARRTLASVKGKRFVIYFSGSRQLAATRGPGGEEVKGWPFAARQAANWPADSRSDPVSPQSLLAYHRTSRFVVCRHFVGVDLRHRLRVLSYRRWGGAMFPISDATLPLPKIADYWSREIRPHASSRELLIQLESAWWRGEIVAAAGASRLALIRHLYESSGDFVFVVPNEPDPRQTERPDGEVEVDLRSLVRVPSTEPASWNDGDCALAYRDLAAATSPLSDLPEFAATFAGICLSHPEFIRWLERRRFNRPKFWVPIESRDDPPQRGASSNLPRRRRGPSPVKRESVVRAMLNEIEQGTLKTADLSEMLEKQLKEKYGVSRDTARKARNEVLSRYDRDK